jgi:hypothetical protein
MNFTTEARRTRRSTGCFFMPAFPAQAESNPFDRFAIEPRGADRKKRSAGLLSERRAAALGPRFHGGGDISFPCLRGVFRAIAQAGAQG